MAEFIVVIEHLEPNINAWILKEYEYVSDLFKPRLIITNVKTVEHRYILSKYAKIYEESVTELLKDEDKVIVLDPKAKASLTPLELKYINYVIIGGIMGSHPPKGRTWLYITSKLPKAHARSIGPYQYTIAGAAYVLKSIELGKKLTDIKFVYGLTIHKNLSDDVKIEVHLPYAFPLNDDGNLVMPIDYIRVVAEHVPVYEHKILNRSKGGV